VHGWHANELSAPPPDWTTPSSLQRLAWRSGLTAEELRELLRREVEKRAGSNGASVSTSVSRGERTEQLAST
jgi:hypothetical protein